MDRQPTNRSQRAKQVVVGAAMSAAVVVYILQQRHAGAIVPPVKPGWTVVRPPEAVDAMIYFEGSIWAGAKDGVWRLGASDARVAEHLDCGQTLSFVHALVREPDGTLWAGHNNGLTRFGPGHCTTLTERDGLPDRRVNALVLDRDGVLWAGTEKGLARREASGWKAIEPAGGLADKQVRVLYQDAAGGLWAGSFVAPAGGLSILENGAVRRFTLADGLPHANIAAICQDHSGAVWVGVGLADRGGLVHFVRKAGAWSIDRVMNHSDGLPGDKVRSIFEDADGYWMGTEMDGLARYRDGKVVRVLTVKDGMPDNEATSILKTPDGALWLGTPSGVVRIVREALLRAGV